MTLLVVAIILAIIFFGVGFAAHVLWWLLIVALILALVGFFSGRNAP